MSSAVLVLQDGLRDAMLELADERRNWAVFSGIRTWDFWHWKIPTVLVLYTNDIK